MSGRKETNTAMPSAVNGKVLHMRSAKDQDNKASSKYIVKFYRPTANPGQIQKRGRPPDPRKVLLRAGNLVNCLPKKTSIQKSGKTLSSVSTISDLSITMPSVGNCKTQDTAETKSIMPKAGSSDVSCLTSLPLEDSSHSVDGSVSKRNASSFRVGQLVLARGTDGLYHIAQILKPQPNKCRCHVEFKDQTTLWCYTKDILTADTVGCDSTSSTTANTCDNCGQVCGDIYQPYQPPPVIDHAAPQSLCHKCILSADQGVCSYMKFAASALVNGTSLPYDLQRLNWDEYHTTNTEAIFCYCGGPGEWYCKMLQCSRCLQWFHEACIPSLKRPLVYGDGFYVYVCHLCNHGHEFIKRLQLKWVDIVQLALFNLTLQHKLRFSDLSEEILPWIGKHWNNLQLGVKNKISEEERVNLIQETLDHNPDRFKCGKEVKKKLSWWALRSRQPPPCPALKLPPADVLTDTIVNDVLVRWQKGAEEVIRRPLVPHIHLTSSGSGKKRCGSSDLDKSRLPTKRARKCINNATSQVGFHRNSQSYKGYTSAYSNYSVTDRSSKPSASSTNSKKNSKINCRPQKGPFCRAVTLKSKLCPKLKRGRPAKLHSSENGSQTGHSRSRSPMGRLGRPDSNGSPARHTLDKFIPRPHNYAGPNHPFKTELERQEELAKWQEAPSLCATEGTDTVGEQEATQKEADAEALASYQVLLPRVRRLKRGRPSRAETEALRARARAALELAKRRGLDASSASPLTTKLTRDLGFRVASPPRQRGPKNVVNKSTLDQMSDREVSLTHLKSSVNSYFGAANRLAHGEGFEVLGRRITPEGKVQYLVEWEGGFIG